ncbi:hypothetical protein HZH68_008200 [Vespula germanica]|uniref:Uncharacterized protein n=1 Tax=Vespula germanica TaxID=30212 RepID=A0A834K3K3_VESGE|nr:hypothetical protein HZH68_008200 [Vespula germanica]
MDISVVVMMVVDDGIGDGTVCRKSSSSSRKIVVVVRVVVAVVAVVAVITALVDQISGPMRRPPQPSENLFGLRIFYVSEENPPKHPPNYASRHVNIDSTVTSRFSAYREVG